VVGQENKRPKEFGLKALLMFSFICVCAAGPAKAEWTRRDIMVEGVWQVLHLVDWGHTLHIVDDPRYWEINPLLGRRPTRARVNVYMAATALLHPFVVTVMPQKIEVFGFELSPQKTFQGVSIMVSGGLVFHNTAIGLEIRY
jgi:hypothetical protein